MSKPNNKLDVLSAVILAFATVLSSWCAFQSSQWNGEQYFRIDDENLAESKRLQAEITAMQRKAGETNYFLYYLQSVREKDTAHARFLMNRFPPHMRKAFDAWMTTDPYRNNAAPASPFVMPEYVLPELDEAAVYRKQSRAFKSSANEADRNSDNYLLLSILISTVLFFTGLSGFTGSGKYQKVLLYTGLVMMVIVIIAMLRLPVLI
jgi:hypothetical protein